MFFVEINKDLIPIAKISDFINDRTKHFLILKTKETIEKILSAQISQEEIQSLTIIFHCDQSGNIISTTLKGASDLLNKITI